MKSLPEKKVPNGGRPDWLTVGTIAVGTVAGLIMIAFIVRAILLPPVMATAAEYWTTTRAAWTMPSPLGEAEREAVEAELDAFVEAVKADELTEIRTFELTEDELNALLEKQWLESDRDWRLTLNLDRGVVAGLVSLRLDGDLTKGMFTPFEGRFVNAHAEFDVFLRDGTLHFEVASLRVKGRNVPRWIVNRLESRIEAINPGADADAREFFAHLDGLEILDGRVVLTAVPPTGERSFPSP